MSIELSAVAPAATGAVKTDPKPATPMAADGVFRQIALAFASQGVPALAPDDAEAVSTGAEAPERDAEVDDAAVLEALLSSEEPVEIRSHPPTEGIESQSPEGIESQNAAAPVERAEQNANNALLSPASPPVATPDATEMQRDEPGPNGVKTVDTTEIRSLPEVRKNSSKQEPIPQTPKGTKIPDTPDLLPLSDEATGSLPARVAKKTAGIQQAQTSLRPEAPPELMASQTSAPSIQRTALPLAKTSAGERSKENATPPLAPLTPTLTEVQKQTQPAQIQPILAKSQGSNGPQDIAPPEKTTDRVMSETTAQPPLLDTPRMAGSTTSYNTGISPMAQPDMRQIAGSLTNLIHAKADATTEIQLSPEELGRVRLVVSTQEHGTTVMVSAERPETADYLRRNLDLLEKTCREMGLDSADISYAESERNDERADQQSEAQQSASPDNSTSGITPQKTAPLSINLDRLDLRL